MTLPYKLLAISLMLLTAFAIGRYSSPTKTVTVTQTQVKEVDHVVTHEETRTTKEKDGSTVTDTTVVTDQTENRNIQTDTTIQQSSAGSPVLRTHVSALAGYDVATSSPRYGLHASRQLFGPLDVGVWVLNPGVLGVSIGVSF